MSARSLIALSPPPPGHTPQCSSAPSLPRFPDPAPHPSAMKMRAAPYASTPPAPPPPSRALLLLLLSLLTIGSHYGKHSLSSLGPEIMAALDLRRVEFGILFSSQELPGIVLPVAGGLALTYVPHAAAAVALSACVLLSTALCAVAVHYKSYAALFAGRFLFGLCDGALTTLQGALVAHWFRHRIGTSFGVTLLVSRLSSFTGLALPAFLSRSIGLRASMWFSVVTCLPGFLATIAYAVWVPRIPPPADLAYTPADDAQGARLLPPDDGPAMDSVAPPRLLAVLRSLSPSFWLISYLWVAVAGAVFSMLHFSTDAFSAHLGFSFAESGLLSGSLVLFAGLASPAVGVAQDRFGRRSLLLGVSCGAIGLGILLCASGVSSESGRAAVVGGLFLVAVGLGIAPVTLLSSLALCVEDVATPAALGLYKGVENAALAVLHVVTGALRDASGEYVQSFGVLAALAASGVLAAAALSRVAPRLKVPAAEARLGHGEVAGEEEGGGV